MKRQLVIVSLLTLCAASGAYAQAAPGQPISPNDPNGIYCREYTQPVVVGGRKVSSYGTACQQPDGSWKIVSNNTQAQAQQQDIQVLGPPVYTGAPQYVAPPPEYYYPPYPAYGSYPYPYGTGVVIGIGGGWHDDYHGGWHGGPGYYHGGYRH